MEDVEGWYDALERYVTDAQRERIAVWCDCLAAYNSGELHGKWLDADVEPDELWQGVREVLATSPVPDAEEHFWANHEGFEGIRIGEYDTVERVTALARLVREHGQAFAAFYGYDESIELDTADEAFQDAYLGVFDSGDDLAHHLWEEFGQELEEEAHRHIPEWAHPYLRFDAESYLNNLEQSGDLYTVEAAHFRLYTFWSR